MERNVAMSRWLWHHGHLTKELRGVTESLTTQLPPGLTLDKMHRDEVFWGIVGYDTHELSETSFVNGFGKVLIPT